MKKLLPMVLLLVPLALAACGEEGDCAAEIKSAFDGTTICVPDAKELAACVIDPPGGCNCDEGLTPFAYYVASDSPKECLCIALESYNATDRKTLIDDCNREMQACEIYSEC